MKNTIIVQDARIIKTQEIPTQAQFQQWADMALLDASAAGDVTIRIVDTEEIQSLNLQYRGKDKPTNVLSFGYDDFPEDYLGDLAICAPVVASESQVNGVDELNHWAHLTIHGILHLRGFDHETETQATEMEQLEITLLQKLGIANPYEIG